MDIGGFNQNHGQDYLLDTCVVYELKEKPPHPNVSAFAIEKVSAINISVMTLAEIQCGIARLIKSGNSTLAAELEAWFKMFQVLAHAHDFTAVPAIQAGKWAGEINTSKIAHIKYPDLIIAATAFTENMILVTRDKDFSNLSSRGLKTIDPWKFTP